MSRCLFVLLTLQASMHLGKGPNKVVNVAGGLVSYYQVSLENSSAVSVVVRKNADRVDSCLNYRRWWLGSPAG